MLQLFKKIIQTHKKTHLCIASKILLTSEMKNLKQNVLEHTIENTFLKLDSHEQQ